MIIDDEASEVLKSIVKVMNSNLEGNNIHIALWSILDGFERHVENKVKRETYDKIIADIVQSKEWLQDA